MNPSYLIAYIVIIINFDFFVNENTPFSKILTKNMISRLKAEIFRLNDTGVIKS